MLLRSKKHTSETNIALLIARVGISVLMLTHGLPKVMKLFANEPIKFASVAGMSPALSLSLAVFAEVFCSLLIIIGAFTRLAVIPPLITMLVAVLYIHANDPFSSQEMGLHYVLVYILLLIQGSGKYSVDWLLQKR